MKEKQIKLLLFFLILIVISPIHGMSEDIEIPSSFNPVGSGARSLGMGGAFIAVADDATAASWNPAGLIQLEKSELSFVISTFSRKEDIDLGKHPEGSGQNTVSELDLNYFSTALPFKLWNRHMVISLSYQHIYDFNRDWQFNTINIEDVLVDKMIANRHTDYIQNGRLSAIGLAYSFQVNPKLSAGITLNIWNDDLTHNHWEQKYVSVETIHFEQGSFPDDKQEIYRNEHYSFNGINANIGMLWNINYKLSLGFVLKMPFRANLDHHISEIRPGGQSIDESYNEDLDMPMSYGVGVAYRFTDNFNASAAISMTQWDDFVHIMEDGTQKNPISGENLTESELSSASQFRMGVEYRLVNQKYGVIIPIRSGFFYDPAPSEGNPDDIYGISIGFGLSTQQFSLDVAYQYRYGNDIGQSSLKMWDFAQDMNEHICYLSMIYYFQK